MAHLELDPDRPVAPPLRRLLEHFHARVPIRAGSLIVTLFGDAILPRGGQLALASLAEIMAAFHVNEGLVRTALSRLVRDGLFDRWKVGRNSFYRLSPAGRETFVAATGRIYDNPSHAWNGRFDFILLDNGGDRTALRAELRDSGYGELGPGWLLHPDAARPLDHPGLLHLAATADTTAAARQVAARAWPVSEIEARYRDFLATAGPVGVALAAGAGLRPIEALALRVLLIHDYRRVILRDPRLPLDLLPELWAGTAARQLCGQLYRAVLPASESWLDQRARDDRGPLPPPG